MSIKDEYRILEFAEHADERGNLVIAEGNQDTIEDLCAAIDKFMK